jgi:hypothetical protein
MTQLLEKEAKFKWSPQCEDAFLTLKKLLTTAPVLAQPNIEKSFDVYCDASSTGIGGVLMQDGRAIAYASRQLRCHEEHCRYPADQVPLRTSSRSKQKVRHANHALPRVINLSMNRTAWGSSGVTACPAAPAPAAQPRAALGSPRVLRLQLPLPGPGQLRGRHVSCGSSSHCPARGNSGVATCPAALAPAAQPGAAPGPPRVP